MVSFGLKTTSFGSISRLTPNPVHFGQAPTGELNENDRSSISGKLISHLVQCKCCEIIFLLYYLYDK